MIGYILVFTNKGCNRKAATFAYFVLRSIKYNYIILVIVMTLCHTYSLLAQNNKKGQDRMFLIKWSQEAI